MKGLCTIFGADRSFGKRFWFSPPHGDFVLCIVTFDSADGLRAGSGNRFGDWHVCWSVPCRVPCVGYDLVSCRCYDLVRTICYTIRYNMLRCVWYVIYALTALPHRAASDLVLCAVPCVALTLLRSVL